MKHSIYCDQIPLEQQQSVFIIYLEISPQYHSASFSRLLVSVMADGAIFDFAGFAGRTGNRHKHTQTSPLKPVYINGMDAHSYIKLKVLS